MYSSRIADEVKLSLRRLLCVTVDLSDRRAVNAINDLTSNKICKREAHRDRFLLTFIHLLVCAGCDGACNVCYKFTTLHIVHVFEINIIFKLQFAIT